MKVLITGANGMLGTNLMKLISYEAIGFTSKELDVSDSKKCIELLESKNPNIIIHTAAYTNVEDCEGNPKKAYKINTIGTQNLVNYCINKDILFIYISSTGIYGTKKENIHYNEFDEVNPTTIHHKSKYEAEKIIQSHLCKYLILRTGWLFGGDIQHNKNFVYKRYLEAKNNREIYSDNSQIGNPTSIKDLVKQIEILIKYNQYGIFNCVNEAKNISRYDYVRKIVELFECNCEVKVADDTMFKRAAPVSKNESAENFKLNLLKINKMINWEISLKEYIEKLKMEINEK
ncbi:MAG: NAD(P)-dependent oxidoreductase [Campylobacteraceae bacterium]|nr:NAD(P)-dependent oxidoreductase [Campylobacteraceae bacterium]